MNHFSVETMVRWRGEQKQNPSRTKKEREKYVGNSAYVSHGTRPMLAASLRRTGWGIGVGFLWRGGEPVGRNPGAFGNILVMAILGMALASHCNLRLSLHSRSKPLNVEAAVEPRSSPER